jgi:hypothetical protein
MTRWFTFALGTLLGALLFSTIQACSPGHGPEPAKLVTPAVKAGCLLIRAISQDGRLDEVCATAEDLAPLLGELLSEHERNVKETPTTVTEPLVAFTISPPKRPQPKRRCAQWIQLGGDGGVPDAAADAR